MAEYQIIVLYLQAQFQFNGTNMFIYDCTINFHHADPAGVLFFGNIFFMAHDAYEALLRSFRMERNYFNDEELILPIVHTEANYYAVIKPGDELNVVIKATSIKSTSFELTYEFIDLQNNIRAIVKTVHVLVRKEDFQKTELTAELLIGLQSIQG
ncbi:MAG: acyl-CoA thioesterase [bacterium]